MINEEISALSLQLNNFKSSLEEAGNKNTCNFDCKDAVGNPHMNTMVREIREMVK